MNFLNIRKITLIIFTVICPIIFVNIQNPVDKNLIFRTSTFITLQTRKLYYNFYESIAQPFRTYVYVVSVIKNNRRLLNENNLLKTQLLKMKEFEIENQKLHQLLDFTKTIDHPFISVRVIGQDPFPEYFLLTIDKGEKDGVQKNQPALTQQGLAGYVWRVQKNTAQVILLASQNAIVPVIVQRSRVHGIVEGFHKNLLYLKYLKNEDDLQEGDILVTSGINQNFPAGYRVGEVSQIQKNDYGLNPTIEVNPSVTFSQIEKLFIILKP